MANTIDLLKNIQCTQIPMTGSDVNFTFNKLTREAWVQAGAATTSMFFAAASASHAPYVLPNGQSSRPLIFGRDIAGLQVTFNGTNATNVSVIEFFDAST